MTQAVFISFNVYLLYFLHVFFNTFYKTCYSCSDLSLHCFISERHVAIMMINLMKLFKFTPKIIFLMLLNLIDMITMLVLNIGTKFLKRDLCTFRSIFVIYCSICASNFTPCLSTLVDSNGSIWY